MIPEKKRSLQCYTKGGNAIILIGPEGDFTNEEIDSAVKNEFIPVHLGTSRLRTETAALLPAIQFTLSISETDLYLP